MTDLYSRYESYVRSLLDTKDISTFKQHDDYTYMLEHVSYNQGLQYLTLLKERTSISVNAIITFCTFNDSVGNPQKFQYDSVYCSPSSLRYLYQSYLILSHFKKYKDDPINIVEIGGGYGGLYLAINFLFDKYDIQIDSYTIIDLPDICKFQELYTSNFSKRIPLSFVESSTYGSNIDKQNIFLISNYCFSEIPDEIQKQYIAHLFPKVSHGFITWNNIQLYDFGFSYLSEDELPRTGPLNKYVRF